MGSVTLEFDSPDIVDNLINLIKGSGTNLRLASTTDLKRNEQFVYKQLTAQGEKDEISQKFEQFIGTDWKKHIIHGDLEKEK